MAKPAYRAYTVIKREGKNDNWLNLGVAFPICYTASMPDTDMARHDAPQPDGV